MATLTYIIFTHHKKKDKTYNVKIRVTHKRKSAYIATQHYIDHKQFNKAGKITDNYLLIEIDRYIKELRHNIVQNSKRTEKMTASQLATFLINYKGDFQLNFIDHIRTHAERYGDGTRKIYLTVANSLEDFATKLMIDDVTYGMIRDYDTHLRKKGLTDTGISLYMRTIRAAFNAARLEHNDDDMINIPQYPFRKYKIPVGATNHRSLDIETIREIFNVRSDLRRVNQARDVFRLSFCLAGMNTIDLFTCQRIEGGRLIYNRTKTHGRRKDSAFMSIKIQPEVAALFDVYKGVDRVFDFHTRYTNRSNFTKHINKGLEKVADSVKIQKLTTYYARHSWATIARNVCRYSKEDVAFCLNHAQNTVTDGYIEVDYSLVDRVNRSVLDAVFVK